MTTDMYDENLILGYIEDELTAEQKASFEQTLKTDARLAALVSSMQQDRAVLGDLDQVTAPMELGDYVSTQLERQMLLGPLPKRRKASSTNYSTPRSRSHSRLMRIWAYGSLAAMFLVIVGLMYQHIGSQSLIERTKQMVFSSDSEKGPTVVMRDEKEFDSTIDDLLKLPPAPVSGETTPATASAKIAKSKQAPDAFFAKTKKLDGMIASDDYVLSKDESASSNALAIPQPTQAPMLGLSEPIAEQEKSADANKSVTMAMRSRGNATATAPISAPTPPTVESLVAMDQPQEVPADSTLLKELSPTTAKLAAEQPTATSSTTPLATGGAMTWSDRDAGDSTQRQLGEKSEVAIALRPVLPTAAPAARQSMMSAPTQLGDARSGNDVSSKSRADKPMTQLGTIVTENQNQVSRLQLQQQQPVCIIEAKRPDEVVQQITDWAVSNRVQIVTPLPASQHAKPANSKPQEQKNKSDIEPLRQVITLDMQANQVPVLVHWLNNQSSQLNNWIAPLPQTHTANESYQRLQQELPLAPTIPLVRPQNNMQIQLMVVPDTRPQPVDKK